MSISGEHHEYIGDIMSTLGVFSTSEGYNEYIWGYSVHWMDTMSTLDGLPWWWWWGGGGGGGGNHEYIGRSIQYVEGIS